MTHSDPRNTGKWDTDALLHHIEARLSDAHVYGQAVIDDLQGQLDRRIAVQQRELRDAVDGLSGRITSVEDHFKIITDHIERSLEKSEAIMAAKAAESNNFKDQWLAIQGSLVTEKRMGELIEALNGRISAVEQREREAAGAERARERSTQRGDFYIGNLLALAMSFIAMVAAVILAITVGGG